jgi:hypothetical protein
MNQISSQKPKVITNFLKKLGFGNQRWQERASHYLLGLSAGFKRFNIESLSQASSQFTYRQNYYFITEAKWNEEELNEQRIAFLNQDKRTRMRPDGVGIIDDTSFKKWGHQTDGVYKQYSPEEGKVANCKVIVSSNYADDKRNYPLDLEPYYKDDVSKLKLAEMLIVKAKKRYPSLKHFTWDSWYCKKSVIRTVEEQGLYFYSQLRQDRKVVYQKRLVKASQLVKLVSTSSVFSGKIYDFKEVYVKELGIYRIVVRNGKIYITNNHEISALEVIKFYEKRWAIDQFYREVKDNLAFSQFQFRKGLYILRHWLMVFLSYTFYIHQKFKGVFAKIYQGTVDTVSKMTKVLQNLNLLRLSKNSLNVLLAQFMLKTVN